MSDDDRSYPDSDTLLPQSGEMNLLDGLIDHSSEETTCRFTVDANHIFARNETVPAWFGIEFMGQCAFYHYQLNQYENEQDPVKALFLGGRDISIYQEQLHPNVTYHVHARDFGTNDRFYAARAKIYPEGEESNRIVQGRLNALLFEEEESLLEQH